MLDEDDKDSAIRERESGVATIQMNTISVDDTINNEMSGLRHDEGDKDEEGLVGDDGRRSCDVASGI